MYYSYVFLDTGMDAFFSLTFLIVHVCFCFQGNLWHRHHQDLCSIPLSMRIHSICICLVPLVIYIIDAVVAVEQSLHRNYQSKSRIEQSRITMTVTSGFDRGQVPTTIGCSLSLLASVVVGCVCCCCCMLTIYTL